MSRLTLAQVKSNLQIFAEQSVSDFEILRALLLSVGRSCSSVTQLIGGTLDQDVTNPTTRLQKALIYFQITPHATAETLQKLHANLLIQTYHPRFIFLTDNHVFMAQDTFHPETIVADSLQNLAQYANFFYPLSGHELPTLAAADDFNNYHAAERVKFLYDALRRENLALFQNSKIDFRHDLNVFFVRLIFCFFAEDTGLFPQNLFTATLQKYIPHNLNTFFTELFCALDTPHKIPKSPFYNFPYIDGTLFKSQNSIQLPEFSERTANLILRAAELDWSKINPDIFGTIFQSIVDQDERSQTGMEYTDLSVIEKVLRPLLLDQLESDFQRAQGNYDALQKLWQRLAEIKIFDPACGSGNFLIVAYKSLRLIEIKILQELIKLDSRTKITSKIKLDHFFGIELEDLPREITVLSLYVAAHQMNLEFTKHFAVQLSLIPIIEIPTIVRGNAVRLDWQKVCPNSGTDEIYVLGNPPYKGAKRQTPSMKFDFQFYFAGQTYAKNLDYISLWFLKGADYIANTRAQLAFVATSSICQGEHAGLLFEQVFARDVEIHFAYTPFKWSGGVDSSSVVTVVIIGLSAQTVKTKLLYVNSQKQIVPALNPYLAASPNCQTVTKSLHPLAPDLPKMQLGSQLIDGGNLIFPLQEYQTLIQQYPQAQKFFRPLIGGSDFLQNRVRYCLYVDEPNYRAACKIPELEQRFMQTVTFREASSFQKFARFPYRFVKDRTVDAPKLIIPRVSSELREYYPVGLVDANTIIPDSAMFVAHPDLWLLALLSSRLHFLWIRTVCGQLETRLRYSATVGYNTFPVSKLSSQQKQLLENSAAQILAARRQHDNKTLTELYRPNLMPQDLRSVHQANDKLVESLYHVNFTNDAERLAELFRRYTNLL